MLTRYALSMPKMVYAGENPYENLSGILRGVHKAVVFTYETVSGAGLLTPYLDALREAGVEYTLVEELPPEPTYIQAEEVIARFRAEKADFIIAAGGGSVMDIAKLASVLDTDRYTIKDLLEKPEIARKTTRTLMIPTTAGTGAEATPNAIVTVPEKALKVGIVNEDMKADYVMLDAEMIRGLPRPIAAATGVDALAHAIECLTSKKANPFSDVFAMEAFELILKNIESACDGDMRAKQAMLIASYYAGVAIGASGTTGVHALSYPLGGRYHIAHGVANAIMLMPVMRFNEPAVRPIFSKAYDRVNADGAFKTEAEKSSCILARMEGIVRALDIPDNLSSFGVGEEAIDELVAAGMEVKRLLDNNIRPITANDARAMYSQVLAKVPEQGGNAQGA